MNRLTKLFDTKKENILNIYFTAGFPNLNDTTDIIRALDASGADLIEIGMPYSDPVADGETIQQSNQVALDNGMTIDLLFSQLKDLRTFTEIPIVLMGYLNPVLQYGVERFCKACADVGIDGLILPDLPFAEYAADFKSIFDKYDLKNTFLITPQTSPERISAIDQISNGFIYMVSSASITGSTRGISPAMEVYFNRVNTMPLTNPRLIGFGISDHETFTKACKYASGAIIGSAFIRVLENEGISGIENYIKSVRNIK